jgi:hypothetical protein
VVEYPPPGADGLTTCPVHPETGRFLPAKCCPNCEPDDGAAEVETPVADRILADLAAQEAADRGVPDMLDLEIYANEARALARAETRHNRKRARQYERRVDDIVEGRLLVTMVDREGGTVDADQDKAAAIWAAEAAKARMAVQKGLDVQAKLIKLAMPAAAARYRAANLKARAKLTGKEAN